MAKPLTIHDIETSNCSILIQFRRGKLLILVKHITMVSTLSVIKLKERARDLKVN